MNGPEIIQMLANGESEDFHELFYMKCPRCNGTKRGEMGYSNWNQCEACDPDGEVISGFGEMLLRFLKDHIKIGA